MTAHHSAHLHRMGALARDSRRPEVVHAARGGGHDYRDTIESLNPQFPTADPKVKAELTKVRAALAAELQAAKAKARAART